MDTNSDLKGKKILVTGGSGFLGRSLVRSLVDQGAIVRVLDDDSRGKVHALADIRDKIDFISGDVRDAKTVQKACDGMQSVCHLAYVNGTEFFYQNPDLVLDVGVKGMINIIDQMRENNIKELLLMSSSEVYQIPPHIPTDESAPLSIPDILNSRYSYGGGKILSELMAINYGRKYLDRVLIIRPHNVYGPQMGWEHVVPQFIMKIRALAQMHKEKKRFDFSIQGTGTETRSFVHVADFTRGVLTVLEKGSHLNIYHVGTMDELPISEVAQEIAKFFGVELTIKPGKLAPGSPLRRCPDISKMRSLGYEPQISFSDGIRATASWYDQFAHLAPDSIIN